jgi:hypothetical protein
VNRALQIVTANAKVYAVAFEGDADIDGSIGSRTYGT